MRACAKNIPSRSTFARPVLTPTRSTRSSPPSRALSRPAYHYRSRFNGGCLVGMQELVTSLRDPRSGIGGVRRSSTFGCNDGSLLGFPRFKVPKPSGRSDRLRLELKKMATMSTHLFRFCAGTDHSAGAMAPLTIITFHHLLVFAHYEDLLVVSRRGKMQLMPPTNRIGSSKTTIWGACS